MKTTKTVTLWRHPSVVGALIIPGTITETRAEALENFHERRDLLTAKEEEMTQAQIDALPEFEG